jgi:hypothetical protein
MKRKHGFVPSALDQLERRVVLSRTTQGLSVVVSGLSPHLKVLNRKQQAMSAEIQQAFTSFQSDYGQARATYLASIAGQATASTQTSSGFTAFSLYTSQRVSLLAQQLINIFIQSPQGTAKVPGQPYAALQLVASKVIGSHGEMPKGSLARSLQSTIPLAGTPAPTTALYTLSQDDAIQTAQVAILNGLSVVKNGAFGIQKIQHY